MLIALAVLVGGGYLAATTGMSALKDRFSPPPDYTGAGSGKVLVEVKDGDNASDIAATLKDKDVVKSIGGVHRRGPRRTPTRWASRSASTSSRSRCRRSPRWTC